MTNNYSIQNLNCETVMVKTKEDFKAWVRKFNVTDKSGNKVDLRKASGGMVVKVNGKFLRVHTTSAQPEDFYKNR